MESARHKNKEIKVCSDCGKENAIIPVGYSVCLQCLQNSINNKEGRSKTRNNQHEEDDIQEGFFYAVRCMFPQLDKLLFAVPNGGKRNRLEAIRLKKQGVVRGISDIICLLSNHKYTCLCLETKTKSGTQSNDQKEFQKQIEKAGGLYIIYRDVEEGINILKEYLKTSNYYK